jgi:hypothetical protein
MRKKLFSSGGANTSGSEEGKEDSGVTDQDTLNFEIGDSDQDEIQLSF